MVDFAGWALPVQYGSTGIKPSCLWTRSSASIFDVSHMQQLILHGPETARHAFLETLCVSSISALKPWQGRYTLLTNENGGIVDDCIVSRLPASHYIVVNAACASKDIAHFRKYLPSELTLEVIEDRALIALQGPKAHVVLGALCDTDLSQVGFFYNFHGLVAGVDAWVSRSGYTGEDGFEISVPADKASVVAEALLRSGEAQPAGLGARDVLRLEAGLCLYGHDMDDNISPVEAGLTWTISPKRRTEGGFIGAEHILKQLQMGVGKVRVGLEGLSGPPAREGAEIANSEGQVVGRVCSGTHSPVLDKTIAMGYVPKELAAEGTQIKTVVRGKSYPAQVVKMPFVPTKYYSKPKTL